jgi:membrane protein involved in colicin uptake
MKQLLFILFVALLLTGCEEAKEAGDKTAREITGANMVEQGRAVEQQLHDIDRQQQQRLKEPEQQ